MKKILTILLSVLLLSKVFAQTQNKTVIISKKINLVDYNEKDSVKIIYIELPIFNAITLKEKTLGAIFKSFENDQNNLDSIIAYGRCNLIKGDKYYFGIHLKGNNKIENGDIIKFKADAPLGYQGLLYNLSNNDIILKTVDEKLFYNIESVYLIQNDEDERVFIKKMIEDIKYTATAMKKQMPDANQKIKSGEFAGIKLFDAMENATNENLISFLKYVSVRPQKYLCATWKICEIYATWLDGGSPMVME